jgi:hypothetical protein
MPRSDADSRETEIKQDGVCDDLGRKSVAFVVDGTKDHTPVNHPNRPR